MARPTLEPVNFASIARGVLVELLEIELPKIARNIDDKSTKPTQPRELTLKLTFKPDQDRKALEIVCSASTKLASVAKHESRAYMGKDVQGNVHIFPQDPRQDVLFDPPAEEDSLINFPKSGS